MQGVAIPLDFLYRIISSCSNRAKGGSPMRAILRTGFGGPDVLVIREIPEPEPKDGHAVIEVKAFGLTHAEPHMRQGEWRENVDVRGMEHEGGSPRTRSYRADHGSP